MKSCNMKFSRIIIKSIVLFASVLVVSNCWALNIVITNDDGFETTNITTLYTALKAAGHNVIISAPFSGQSGVGAKHEVYAPIMPVTEASPGGTIPAGSPGFGPIPGDPDIFYVDGTPAMAAYYGVDVAAHYRFESGKVDLVISGPNEGPNLSFVTKTSGTVGAAGHMLSRGFQAIAVSANNGNPETAPEVADVVVEIVDSLIDNAKDGVLMPKGFGLNVNIPQFDAGQGADLELMHTEVGNYLGFEGLPLGYSVKFLFHEDLSNDMFYGSDFTGYGLGGIGMTLVPGELPKKHQEEGFYAISVLDEAGNVVIPGKVTISVIEGHYGNNNPKTNKFARKLVRNKNKTKNN